MKNGKSKKKKIEINRKLEKDKKNHIMRLEVYLCLQLK